MITKACPKCGPSILLELRTNTKTGEQFLACPGSFHRPECRYTEDLPEAWRMRAAGQPNMFDEERHEP